MYAVAMDEPENPLSPMMETAVGLHEWFVSLCEAGFTEEQSLYLIVESMRANNRGDVE